MAGTIKGILVEIGGDTSGLQKALTKVNTATSSLSKELRGVNSLLKLDPKNIELTKQKQEILTKSIGETSKKLEELRKVEEMANSERDKISDENYRNLQREIANTEYKLKQLQVQASKWTKAGDNLEAFGNKVVSISGKLNNMGNTLTTSLTLPVLAIGTAAISTGNDFEAQMSRVQAIAGATKEELKKLTDLAVDLGAKTSFSASEVAAGMENLASAGFSTNEIIQAMPGLLDLAASSGAELAISSEIAASSIRGFGLEANKSGHVADVFAEASARTNAQVEDMGEAMKYVAPVAKTVGLSIEETAAAIGIMSDAGVKGSQAGTTLRGGLTRIVKPTKQVKEAMEELGVEFYNSNGTMKSLTQIIQTLQEHTKGLTDETKNQALAQIFGTEALSGMMALVNRGSSELDKMTKSFEKCDGSAKEMADTMLDNSKGAIESLTGSLESAGIAIQQALAPEIKDLSKWIQGLVDDFNDLSDEEKQNIVRTALLVATIGPAIKILGKLGTGLGTVTKGAGIFSKAIIHLIKNTTSANTAVNSTVKGLKAVISPMGLMTTTTIGCTVALATLYSETNKNNQAISESAKQIENAKNKYNEFIQEKNNIMSTTLTEVANTQKLSEELRTLVDENGKIKAGYKERVAFILGELKKSLGIEYNMTGDVITNYKELNKSIEDVIRTKRANAILENEEAKYNEAREKRTSAYDDIISKEKELANAKEELIKKEKEYQEFSESWEGKVNTNQTKWLEKQVEMQKEATKLAEQNLNDSKNIYNNYLNDIATYENDQAIVLSGNNEKIEELIKSRTYTYQQSSNDIGETINHNIQQVQYEIGQYEAARQQDLKNQDKANAEKNQKQVEANKKQLRALGEQLAQMTSTTEAMTPQQIEAWNNLANGSYEVYSEIVSNMGPTMKQKVQEATGVIAAGTPQMQAVAGELAQKTIDEFNKGGEAKQKALNTIQGYLEGLNDEQKRNLLKQAGIEDVNKVIEELNRGDLSEESGKNILEGLWHGLKNDSWQKNIIGVVAGLAKSITSSLSIKIPKPKIGASQFATGELLPGHKTGLSYVPYDNYIARLHKGERVLTAKENKQLMAMQKGSKIKEFNFKGLANNITNKNNFYFSMQINPKSLTEADMKKCFDFWERKAGKYF